MKGIFLNQKVLLFICFIFLSSSFLIFHSNDLPFVHDEDKLYHPIKKNNFKLATAPVLKLMHYLQNNSLHTIKSVFNSDDDYGAFCQFYNLKDKNNQFRTTNFITDHFIQLKIVSSSPASKNDLSDYFIKVEQSQEGSKEKVIWNITTSFDKNSRQYFIKHLVCQGQISTNTNTGIEIPTVLTSPCEPTGGSKFRYISLKSRTSNSSDTSSEIYVPDFDIAGLTTVSYDAFYKSKVFRQVKFDKLVDHKKAPDPGYVLSIKDLKESEIKDANGNDAQLFADVYDAYGVFFCHERMENL